MWKIRQGSAVQSSAPPEKERREEQHFEVSRLDLREGERERGQPFGVERNNYCVEGVPPSPLFIGGWEGANLGEGGSP